MRSYRGGWERGHSLAVWAGERRNGFCLWQSICDNERRAERRKGYVRGESPRPQGCYLLFKVLEKDKQAGLVGKHACCQPNSLNLSSRTHTVEGGNRSLQINPWPPIGMLWLFLQAPTHLTILTFLAPPPTLPPNKCRYKVELRKSSASEKW